MKKMLVTDVMLGSDPELFVVEKNSSTFVPSLDLVHGTKDNPRAMLVPGFFVQEDNVLLEFNIPPAKTKEAFVTSLISGLDQIEKMLPSPELGVVIQTSHKFKPEQLLDPRANRFGCDPDMNAWTKEFNRAPGIPVDGLRTAGGHIHIGYKDVNKGTNRELIKAMDFFLGVPSIVIDKDTERRKLYGKAGAYRNKPYGTEYRTLSSFWLASPELMGWAYDQTMKAIDFVNNGQEVPVEVLVVDTINNSDARTAKSLCKEYKLTEII